MHKKESGIAIIFPGPVGFLLATALRNDGRDVLVINHPRHGGIDAPALLDSAVYFPEVFLQDAGKFGIPEPEIGEREVISFFMGTKRIAITPDNSSQIMEISRLAPKYDKAVMDILTRLNGVYGHMAAGLGDRYRLLQSKLELGRKLDSGDSGTTLKRILASLPEQDEGLVARSALTLPGYLPLGMQSTSSGAKALAAGYGLRCPAFANIGAKKLSIEAEHMYLNSGGDYIDLKPAGFLEIGFTAGGGGTMSIEGESFRFRMALLPRDVAATAFTGRQELQSHVHGLTIISHAFDYKPPERFDTRQPKHGLILTDPVRPPVNDNLVLYSIEPKPGGAWRVSLAITVERSEMLSENFVDKRRNHLIARMVSSFMTALGGELSTEKIEPPAHPPLKVSGRGSFRFYTDNLIPGFSLEDILRQARWLSERQEFRMA